MYAENQKQPWQDALANLITDPKELWEILALDPTLLDAAYAAARQFPLKVPRGFAARMQKGNIQDPLLKQVLPLGAELETVSGYSVDPLEEQEANPIPGLLHKYKSRVLVTLTSACAVHCRYCFRRHFPYADNNPGRQGWEKLLTYIREDKHINEVILSGGDPLSVSDKLLQLFSDELSQLPQVKRLRIHTRLPVVLPERITDTFLTWVAQLKQQLIIVLHVNHPQELSKEVVSTIQLLKKSSVTLLNQSVLLKDVNDDADTLIALSEKLFSTGVLPYYLHLLDKVQGAAHFDVALERSKEIHAEMLARLPGYLVPRLVKEEAGKEAKTII